jgi:hypothetical protein
MSIMPFSQNQDLVAENVPTALSRLSGILNQYACAFVPADEISLESTTSQAHSPVDERRMHELARRRTALVEPTGVAHLRVVKK